MFAWKREVEKDLQSSLHKTGPTLIPSAAAGKPSNAAATLLAKKCPAVKIRVEAVNVIRLSELLSVALTTSSGHIKSIKRGARPQRFRLNGISARRSLKNAIPCKIYNIALVLSCTDPVAPLENKVQGGRNTDNNLLAPGIKTAIKVRLLGLWIYRILWLYDGKEHEWAEKNGHKGNSGTNSTIRSL